MERYGSWEVDADGDQTRFSVDMVQFLVDGAYNGHVILFPGCSRGEAVTLVAKRLLEGAGPSLCWEPTMRMEVLTEPKRFILRRETVGGAWVQKRMTFNEAMMLKWLRDDGTVMTDNEVGLAFMAFSTVKSMSSMWTATWAPGAGYTEERLRKVAAAASGDAVVNSPGSIVSTPPPAAMDVVESTEGA